MKTRKIGFIALSAFLVVGTSSAINAAPQNRGDYVIKFVDSVNLENEIAAIKGNGGKVKATFSAVFKGAAVNLSDSQAQGLAHNPKIEIIEADGVVTTSATLPTTQDNVPSWGLARIDQPTKLGAAPYSYSYTSNGTGVTAYIIDTGIDTTVTDFGGRASMGTNTTGDGIDKDCNGHGTHVSGTVGGALYGVAKNVNLVGVKVLDCNGSGSFSGVIAGINWVISNHLSTAPTAVANMSLGGGKSSTVNAAVASLVNDGVVTVVAAGNSNANACNTSPASASSAITVGATTLADARASYSNYGSCLDIFAPGSGITSDQPGDTSATWNGTSMATPHVTGVVARLLQASPTASTASIASTIKTTASANKLTSIGANSPNLLVFIDPTK